MSAGKGIAALTGGCPYRRKTHEEDPMHRHDDHDDSRLLSMENSPEAVVKRSGHQTENRRDVLMRATIFATLALAAIFSLAAPATADPFFFSTGNPDFKMATATRPDNGSGQFEIETGDDFVLTNHTLINHATFQGLLVGSDVNNIGQVRVEIYRVFPADSDVTRTSGPPTFSTSNVPTRFNSPSDVELVDRDTANGNLSF